MTAISPSFSLFDKKSTAWILLFLLPLLFLPKINIIKFSESETAGLRIDDLLLFSFLPIIIWARIAISHPLIKIEKLFGLFVFFSFLSYGINKLLVVERFLNVESNLLYALRPIEYFLFFYLGLLLTSYFSLNSLMNWLFGVYAAVMCAQKIGWLGQFTQNGYSNQVDGRILGLASFPSEMGALLNLFFCYILHANPLRSPLKNFAIFLFFGFLTNLTGSRIALFGLIVAYGAYLLFSSRQSILKTALFFMIGSVFILLAITSNPEVIERSKGLASVKNIDLIERVWNAIETHYDPCGNEVIKQNLASNDTSWWIRIHKWCRALKIYLQHPGCYLQGIGPGFATPALDGGFLRLLVENGLIGVFLFCTLLKTIARENRPLKWMVFLFCFNLIFFDAYLAYKPMTLLFIVYGASLSIRQQD